MNNQYIKYYCKYYSVGFFVFMESCDPMVIEPIMEVDDEAHGDRFINWLSQNEFVAKQIINVANDSFTNSIS